MPPTPPQDNLKAVAWVLLSAALLAGMHAGVRLVSEELHPFEIAFFRNLFGLTVILPWFVRYGTGFLKTARLGLLLSRGAINTVSMLCFFMALSIMPLAEATALSFTAPIFAVLVAMVTLGEKVGKYRWAAILIGFSGVLVVLRPGFGTIGLGQVLVLGSALGLAICIAIIKELGRTESAVTITAYMSLVMAPLSLIPALFVWRWPNGEQLALLLLIGVLGGLSQLTLSQSLRLGETHVVAPMDFTRLLFVAVLAYVLFDQVPSVSVWIGGGIIVSAIAFITYRERMRRRSAG